MKKSDIKTHINRLGNLLLISDRLNGKLGNKSCKDKLEIIDNSKTEMELLRELIKNLKAKIWDFQAITPVNFEAIEKRQKYLSTISYEIWVTDLRKKLGY